MKIRLIFLILFFSYTSITSQENFPTEYKTISLAKIWGFLKYYHPNVAKGIYDWDNEFLKLYTKIEKSQNKEELSKIYLEWINELGEIKECKECDRIKTNKQFEKNLDLTWIKDSILFTPELSKKLLFIKNNRYLGRHKYVNLDVNGNIKVINEPQYNDFEFPGVSHRVLDLIKYWNVIEYFYPYKYMMDQDWNEVLVELLPKFQYAKNTTEYHLSILELVTKIDDSHGYFVTPFTNNFFGLKWIPVGFVVIGGKAVVNKIFNDSLAQANDLRIGDIIIEANNKSIEEIIKENDKYIPASNKATKYRNAYAVLFNGSTDSINIKVDRFGKTQNLYVKRYLFKEFNLKDGNIDQVEHEILNDSICYINMGLLSAKKSFLITKKFKNECPKAIIFDMRNGTPYVLGLTRILGSKQKSFVKRLLPNISYPGMFVWEENSKTGKRNRNSYQGKIVILVNQNTQSRSEYITMMLQSLDNSITIGNQTAGADGTITKYQFMGGHVTSFSGVGIYYPDGSPAQRKGVKIDIEVNPTIEGIQKGKDEILEATLEYLNKR